MEPIFAQIRPEESGELTAFLNEVFSGAPDSGHFEENLPRMCRSERRICGHYVLRDGEGGRILAAVAVFPFGVTIGERTLRFATVGNVAVAEDCRGKGYMRRLMAEAMRMLRETDTDASRLGGLRSRYERYGYEPCGVLHRFTVTPRNLADLRHGLDGADPGAFSFEPMRRDDGEAIALADALYRKNGIWLHRAESGSLYDSLRMWKSVPRTVRDGAGRIRGYLSTDAGGGSVHEYGWDGPDNERFAMLCAYAAMRGSDTVFSVYPWDAGLGAAFSRISEGYQIGIPSNFKILRWDRVLPALMELKIRTEARALPEGELCFGIPDFGVLRLRMNELGCSAVREAEGSAADCVRIDPLALSRLCFGPYPSAFTELSESIPDGRARDLIRAWFPLPLSWNKCDNL
ncbi:MAG: GNAT family N-acetyltransferase [Ruminococcaceae bacterium]|nr:GNAT family N-acetyltransferase [Oscillospiraceae bacterium]